MQTSYISTAALRNQPRYEVQRLQVEVSDRSRELATSRHADVGLTLGNDTGRMVVLRNEVQLIETLMRSNGTAAARLSVTQAALSDMRDNASSLLEALVALPPGVQAANLIELEGLSGLERVADRLNASDGGSYVFGGLNTADAPFTRYADGPQAVVEAAFLARFGMTVGSATANTISPADMADFLANDFSLLFDDPGWGTDWSSASSNNLVSRIAVSQRATTGTNANEQAIRNVVEGFVMVAGLGLSALSQDSRDVVVNAARVLIGQAISDLAMLQGELGFSENAIERADQRLILSRNLLSESIADTEGTDPTEAKVQLDLLTTQLEMSFALTGQLSRLSILNYA
ncbi:MAG: flagellar hook-associated family protein [Pseudomonadota bacterium]